MIPMEGIVKAIKGKPFEIAPVQSNRTHSCAKLFKAKQIISENCISYVAQQGCFVVRSVYKCYTVQIHPNHKCSCPASTDCVHILAVLLSLNVPESDLKPKKKIVNLTVLSKNVRGKKKPGRKMPRPGDVEYDPPDLPHLPDPEIDNSPEKNDSNITPSSAEIGIRDLLYEEDVWIPACNMYKIDITFREKERIQSE
jgi:hypothetical protein